MTTDSGQIDPSPLLEWEYALVAAALEGDDYEMRLIRSQFDSTRYASPWYVPKHFLGCQIRWRNALVWRGGVYFRIAHGAGAEDWLAANRRRLYIRDLVIVGVSGDRCDTELLLDRGMLRSLTLRGFDVAYPTQRRKLKRLLQDARLLYKPYGSPDGRPLQQNRDPRQLYEVLPPPIQHSAGNDVQKWLLVHEEHEVLPPQLWKLSLPLRFRRCRPATDWELSDIKRRAGGDLPFELESLWRLTNGGMFFGWMIHSTEEAYLHRYRGGWCLACMRSYFDDMRFFTIGVERGRPDYGRVFGLNLSDGESEGVWTDLRSALASVVRGEAPAVQA